MTYEATLMALADPTRRKIFEAVWQAPRSVTELAKDQTVSRPAVSQHLKVLEQAQLVHATPQGRQRVYAVRPAGLAPLRAYLDHFWSDALGAYAAQVHRHVKEN